MSRKQSQAARQRAEAEHQRQRLMQARQNLASRMEDQLSALEAPFVAVFEEVESLVGDWMHEQGFDKDGGVNDKLADIALMHTELSEAAEAIRKVYKHQEVAVTLGAPTPVVQEAHVEDPVAEELADTIIRIMHFSALHGHNTAGAVISKCVANLRRPFMHGKKA